MTHEQSAPASEIPADLPLAGTLRLFRMAVEAGVERRETLIQTLERAAVELEQMEKLVYVPGIVRCPKCQFNLVATEMDATTGLMRASRSVGEPCPNCATPLRRVTERDAGNQLVERLEQLSVDLQTVTDAAKWRALRNCARITTMGSAGLGPDNEADDYAHVTLNFWTGSEFPPDFVDESPLARQWLDRFVTKAVRVLRAKEAQR
jgi:hypothetical protein